MKKRIKRIPIDTKVPYYASTDGEIFKTQKDALVQVVGWKHTSTSYPNNPGNGKKYLRVGLQMKNGSRYLQLIHRLIIETFKGTAKPGDIVRHGEGGTLDNRLSNLSYGTPADNYEDAVEHGSVNRDKRGKFATQEIEEVCPF